METQTRYDLNAAIENWRFELAAQPNLTAEVRRELETHLRDTISGFQQKSLGDKESFLRAKQRIGRPQVLGKEFSKVEATEWSRRPAMLAWLLFAVSLMLPSAG